MDVLTLLPMKDGELDHVLAGFFADSDEADVDELKLHCNLDLEEWLSDQGGGSFPESLKELLDHLEWFNQLAQSVNLRSYKLYAKIVQSVADAEDLSRRHAAVIISHLPLMLSLAKEFKYSSAGIAKVICDISGDLSLHWKGVDKIFSVVKLSQKLNEHEISDLLALDQSNCQAKWADSNGKVIAEMLSSDASRLGLNIGDSFDWLFNPQDSEVFAPYLQALLYLCAVINFYNHPAEFLYTFKPRGQVATTVFSVFPPELASTGNPILNNFKAVDRLSFDWARSRDDNRSQACALVRVVNAMSAMPYCSRKMFASRIREAIFRLIEIKSPKPIVLSRARSYADIRVVLDRVAEGNTQTSGVIEQRVVDFVSAYINRDVAWRPRGLGDPVNASNFSAKKLGDCDYQNAYEHKCVAYEAHGGRLSDVYVKEHMRSLQRSIPMRLEEWKHISDLDLWSLKLIFVAHEISDGIFRDYDLPVNFVMNVISYNQYFNYLVGDCDEGRLVELFNQWVVDILDGDNVPYYVKEKYNSLCADGE